MKDKLFCEKVVEREQKRLKLKKQVGPMLKAFLKRIKDKSMKLKLFNW